MIKGIMPPMATPFTDDKINFGFLENNISKLNKTGISGYVFMGSNGESAYLSNDEKIKIIELTKNVAQNDKKIIAGTGLESISGTIELTNACADKGADYALVLTPSFFQGKMNHEAMISYFNSVADNSNIPVVIYNVPKFTGVNISANTVSELSKHENIVGIKSSSENIADIAELVFNVDKDFSVISGTASVLYPALTVGATGGVLALANIAPNQCVDIYNAYENRETDKALSIQYKMIAANKAITAMFGVAGLKHAMSLLGYEGGEPRKPLTLLNEKEIQTLKNILTKAEII